MGSHCGGMLAFALAGDDGATGRFLGALDLPTIAVSLGDTATLIWPLAGSNLIRVSVGLEDWADLDADFAGALAHVEGVGSRHSQPVAATR